MVKICGGCCAERFSCRCRLAVKACENALRCIGNDDVQPYLFVKMLCDKSLSAHRLSLTSLSLLFDLPEFSHLGWGHWFTLRDLELATNKFSKANIIGEGGYGVVYQGQLINGNPVAIKMLLNNLGQAEKEFRVDV
ncbi:probable receptor-like protein kinase At5g18500 isoform X1 [Trifolium pratense]|uniref:probable receptor-like protein kinase At5g18500 isoform X1 n=1 Tax=Trifolium pratense TaxID=57577 RepID=UPI001E6943F8|nr:probable receptor-like protein kinase At5g18500 isoform X1 [Trifolium pratense]